MYACIFIPDFSVQAIIRFEPELRTRPVAVLTGRPPLEKVVALNESARQSGVEIGATKSQLEPWEICRWMCCWKVFLPMRRRPHAGLKHLIAGAFANCGRWRLFPKFRSASAWDSRESVCKNWRGARRRANCVYWNRG